MTKQIEEKVFSYMEKYQMLQAGDCVVAGVSGGADSVCLLFLLCEYKKRVPFELKVVHVHHGIREDAEADVTYVEELCRTLKLSCQIVREDVPAIAKRERLSLEEAGRMVRYRAFAEAASKIAVAHNAEDNAETILFHLFRGTGVTGMCGILPSRDQLIRPLLCLSRKEIEGYLTSRGISWQTDQTNLSDEYTRNRIRHHILPEAEAVCEGAVSHMNQYAEAMQELEDYLAKELIRVEKDCCQVLTDEYARVEIQGFSELHPFLQKELAMQLLAKVSGGRKDLTSLHVDKLLELVGEAGNRELHFPKGVVARRTYGIVEIYQKDSENINQNINRRDVQNSINKETYKNVHIDNPKDELEKEDELKNHFVLEYYSREEYDKIFPSGEKPENTTYTKWFDYDKIGTFMEFRTRKQGDYLVLRGQDGGLIHKLVKDYMINEKIPARERDSIPCIMKGSQCIWLVGYRISEDCKITDCTQNIMKVMYI